jgi:glycosyltransferase 2 family protein
VNSIEKKHILIVVKLTVTIILFYLIIKNIDFQKILVILDNFDALYFLWAMGLLLFQIIIATFRWRIVLEELSVKFSLTRVLSFLWVGLFFNQALPSSVGGDAFRGYCIYKNGYSIRKSSIGVLLDRLFGMVGLLLLTVASLPLMFNMVDSKEVQWGSIIVILSAFVVIAAALLLDLLPKQIAHFKIIKGFFAFSKEGRRQIFSFYPGAILILISIVIHFMSIVAMITLGEGLDLNVAWYNMLFIVAFVTLLSAVPISIAGWGVREGIMVVGLGYLGVVPEQALVLSILYGVLMLAFSLPGLIIWYISDYLTNEK